MRLFSPPHQSDPVMRGRPAPEQPQEASALTRRNGIPRKHDVLLDPFSKAQPSAPRVSSTAPSRRRLVQSLSQPRPLFLPVPQVVMIGVLVPVNSPRHKVMRDQMLN